MRAKTYARDLEHDFCAKAIAARKLSAQCSVNIANGKAFEASEIRFRSVDSIPSLRRSAKQRPCVTPFAGSGKRPAALHVDSKLIRTQADSMPRNSLTFRRDARLIVGHPITGFMS